MIKASTSNKKAKKYVLKDREREYKSFFKYLNKRIFKQLDQEIRSASERGSLKLIITLRELAAYIRYSFKEKYIDISDTFPYIFLYETFAYDAPESFNFYEHFLSLIKPKLEDLGYRVDVDSYNTDLDTLITIKWENS